MAYSARQLVTSSSIIFLLILTAVAGYALHRVRFLSLPIPTVLAAFTLALPPLAGFSLATVLKAATTKHRDPEITREALSSSKQPSQLPLLAIFFLSIYETVIVVLSATYMGPPSALNCGLDETWTTLFRAKNAEKIRAIQDAFDCCGFRAPWDMAYPFPKGDIDINTCRTRYDRGKACMWDWKAEEQRVAGLMLMVALLTFVWKLGVVLVPFLTRSSWLNSFFHPLGAGGPEENGAFQRAIGYTDGTEPYTDESPVETTVGRVIGEESARGIDTIEDSPQEVQPQRLPPLNDRAVWET